LPRPDSTTGRRARRACALLLTAALASSGCDGDSDADWIARIDGSEVTVAQLESLLATRFEQDPDAPRDQVLSRELHRLVNKRVALNRAKQLGIEIAEDEVTERIRRIHGEDWEDHSTGYRHRVRDQMLADRAALIDVADGITLPETALVDYFEERRAEYATPERAAVRQIVVETEAKARRMIDLIGDDADFATLARTHSLAPDAEQGGLLPPFARGELPEAFDRAFSLEVGEVSDVVESTYGFHVFLLVEKLPPQEPELDDVREQLVVQLESERLTDLRHKWLWNLRRAAHVEVNEPVLEALR